VPVRVAELYGRKRPVFSFEFFPPADVRAAKELFETIRELARFLPDYRSPWSAARSPSR
jgi:5,10-methylenetetrahydrofolate reductase